MYQGNNQIAKRSQEWLAKSLLEILQTKEYTKISIKDICDKADLSRQTFYQMFDSKEEVARYAIQFLKNMALPSCCSTFDSSEDMKAAARQFASGVRENKNIILLYRKNNLQHILYDELSKTLSCLEKN